VFIYLLDIHDPISDSLDDSTATVNQSHANISALIVEELLVGDSWLIHDVISPKRKRTDHMFTVSPKRKTRDFDVPRSQQLSRAKPAKRLKRNTFEFVNEHNKPASKPVQVAPNQLGDGSGPYVADDSDVESDECSVASATFENEDLGYVRRLSDPVVDVDSVVIGSSQESYSSRIAAPVHSTGNHVLRRFIHNHDPAPDIRDYLCSRDTIDRTVHCTNDHERISSAGVATRKDDGHVRSVAVHDIRPVVVQDRPVIVMRLKVRVDGKLILVPIYQRLEPSCY